MIDVHVHLAGLPDGKNGCFISPKMLESWLFRGFIKSMGLPLEDPARANELYLERLVRTLSESKAVQQAVLLGMDGVYKEDGVFDPAETHFLVPNGYVFAAVRRFPERFLAGASVNPVRRDAIQELERCSAEGAVLVKVLPNSQQFNPADPAFLPYWKTLARLKLPLLCHVGYEFSLMGKDQSVGDPARLRGALEAGVTVIAAHGASFGLFFYEKYWDTLRDLVARYPHFYWDASALSLPNRARMLLKIRRHPELRERVVFGTDYPLPSNAYPAALAGQWELYQELRRITNPFDRHVRLLEGLGFRPNDCRLDLRRAGEKSRHGTVREPHDA
jgi:predicted TIM-barrel fold metal-dependent hydrolase